MFTFATSPQIPKHAAAPRLLRNRLRATVCFCLAVFSFSAIAFNDPQFAGRFFRRHLADVHRTNSMQGVHPVFAMPIPVYGPAPIAAGACASASDSGAALNGRVTFDGTPKKFEAIDVSPEPNCAKFYTSSPMLEVSVTGPQNSLQNVMVYIRRSARRELYQSRRSFDRRGCQYAPHVVTALTNQEVWVQNDDAVAHSVHLMAHANPEWNRSQPPGTP